LKINNLRSNLRNIYRWLRHPGESLSARVIHGGVWVFLLKVVSRGFGLIRTVILARLLAPNDFGLFGIATLAIAALQRFSRTGFDASIIQNKEDTRSYLNPAWTVKVLRGLILAIVLVLGAPLVGAFFQEPRAVILVRVLGASVLLGATKNIGIIYFRKELEFHKQFAYRLSGTFADLAVAIPAAFILRSVWALIFGLLAGNFVRLIMSYCIHPYRPAFDFDLEKIKEMFDFGRWILGTSIVVFIATKGDDIFLGKILGATALGYYRLAYTIANTVTTEITHVISRVTFPAYSKLQDDLVALKSAFIRTMSLATALSVPLAVGIFLLVPDFTRIFLGEKWLPIVAPVKVLVVAAAIRSIAAIWGPLYRASGIPSQDFWQNIWRVIFTFTPIYFLAQFAGITGVSIAVLLGILAALIYDFYYVERISKLDLNSREVLKALSFPLAGSIPFILFTLLFKNFLPLHLVHLVVIVVVDIVLYGISIYGLELVTDITLIRDVKELLIK